MKVRAAPLNGRYNYLRLSIAQKERTVLDRIVAFLGAGTVQRNNRTGCHQLILFNHQAHRVAQKILPLMHSPYKIKQLALKLVQCPHRPNHRLGRPHKFT